MEQLGSPVDKELSEFDLRTLFSDEIFDFIIEKLFGRASCQGLQTAIHSLHELFEFLNDVSIQVLPKHRFKLCLHGFEMLYVDLDVTIEDQYKVLLEHELADFDLFVLHVNLNERLNLPCLFKRRDLHLRVVFREVLFATQDFFALLDSLARGLYLLGNFLNLINAWDLAVHSEMMEIGLDA